MVDCESAVARSRSSSVSTTSSSAALPTFEALAPPRPPTTTKAEETVLGIPFLDKDVRLKVDAGPGCGGIAWPAGIVSHESFLNGITLMIRSFRNTLLGDIVILDSILTERLLWSLEAEQD
jgi:hypothetical protein